MRARAGVCAVSFIRHEYLPNKPLVGTAIISAFVKYTGANPGDVGPEDTQIWGPSLRKRTQNYGYKIRCVSEYLFRMRK